MPNLRSPSLQIFTPLSRGLSFVADLTTVKQQYRHTIRAKGGYWTCNFNLEIPEKAKINFFNKYIGYHLKETIGGVITWEGLIWEMQISYMGITRKISMSEVANAILVTYIDENDDERKSTSWYTDTNSINTYGRIEKVLYIDTATSATANAYAQSYLTENAFPQPVVTSATQANPNEPIGLTVTGVGYAWTMNYQYTSVFAASATISYFIGEVVDTDCPMVINTKIDANTTTIAPPDNTTIKAWDWLENAADIGDGSSPYNIQVLANRYFTYTIISNLPTLHWYGNGQLTTALGRRGLDSAWLLQPGVMRDHTWPIQTPRPGAFLQQSNDTYITEIEVNENQPFPILKTTFYEESEMQASIIREYNKLQRFYESLESSKGTSDPDAPGLPGEHRWPEEIPEPDPEAPGLPYNG